MKSHNDPRADAELFINGELVGNILVQGTEDSWSHGRFRPEAAFSRYAPLFGRWSLLLHADGPYERLSAATSAGANQLYGIRFEIEDLAPLQAEARKKAVEDARARAERLAQLAGVKLGPAVSIVELDGGGSGPVPTMAMARMEAAAPVERGELTISTTVQIVYALPE